MRSQRVGYNSAANTFTRKSGLPESCSSEACSVEAGTWSVEGSVREGGAPNQTGVGEASPPAAAPGAQHGGLCGLLGPKAPCGYPSPPPRASHLPGENTTEASHVQGSVLGAGRPAPEGL